MHLPRSASLLLFVAGLTAAGCASPAGDGASSTASESAFTVDRGDRFVVSATPERIVLKKSVDGVAFPFDEASLLGKAVLIHPVDRRAAHGVYARVLSVASEDDRLVIASEPLTLSEMETVAESDVVRIFIDSKRTLLGPTARLGGGSIRPLGTGNIGVDGFTFTAYAGLSRPALLSPGVTFTHEIEESSFEPDVLLAWTHENGLEIGVKAALDWKSKLTIGGRAGGEFFRSMTVSTPELVVTVPIGIVPVPVTLSASAFVSCSALTTAPMQLAISIAFDAKIGGSVYVDPSIDTGPTSWVRQGSWTPEATGNASITPDITSADGVSIMCAAPRMELKALVAGVTGPYLAITPMVTISGPSPTFQASLAAGFQGSLMGHSGGAEVNIVTWKPDLNL